MVYPYVVNHNGKEYKIGEDVPIEDMSAPISVCSEKAVMGKKEPKPMEDTTNAIKKPTKGKKKV